MRRYPGILTLLVAAGGGCCHTAAPGAGHPLEVEETIPLLALDGPRCGADGPAVEVLTAQRYGCRKGDTCTVVDLRIRNPEQRALFLLVDGDRHIAGYMTSVSIIYQDWGKPTPPVWDFSGALAFKVAPGADIVIHDLHFTSNLAQFPAVFFHRAVLNYDRRIDANDPEGRLPAHGQRGATISAPSWPCRPGNPGGSSPA